MAKTKQNQLMTMRKIDFLAVNNQILFFHDRSEKSYSLNGERLSRTLLMRFDRTLGPKTNEEVQLTLLDDMIVGRK